MKTCLIPFCKRQKQKSSRSFSHQCLLYCALGVCRSRNIQSGRSLLTEEPLIVFHWRPIREMTLPVVKEGRAVIKAEHVHLTTTSASLKRPEQFSSRRTWPLGLHAEKHELHGETDTKLPLWVCKKSIQHFLCASLYWFHNTSNTRWNTLCRNGAPLSKSAHILWLIWKTRSGCINLTSVALIARIINFSGRCSHSRAEKQQNTIRNATICSESSVREWRSLPQKLLWPAGASNKWFNKLQQITTFLFQHSINKE